MFVTSPYCAMNHSGSLRLENLALKIGARTLYFKPLKLRALSGQTSIHRQHDMHLSVSVSYGFTGLIASTGHSRMHRPQLPHFFLFTSG